MTSIGATNDWWKKDRGGQLPSDDSDDSDYDPKEIQPEHSQLKVKKSKAKIYHTKEDYKPQLVSDRPNSIVMKFSRSHVKTVKNKLHRKRTKSAGDYENNVIGCAENDVVKACDDTPTRKEKKRHASEDLSKPKLKKKYRKRSDNSCNVESVKFKSSKHKRKQESEFDENSTEYNFPENILLKIFQYAVKADGAVPFLIRAAKVNSTWKSVSEHSSLWRHVDLSRGSVKKHEKTIHEIGSDNLSQIHELNLNGWDTGLILNVMDIIIYNCKMLTSISLSGCVAVNDKAIRLLAENCERLCSIDLSSISKGSSSGDSAVSVNSIRCFVSVAGKSLTYLNLSGNVIKGVNFVVNIVAEHCPKLHVLDLSNILHCTGVNSIQIEKLQVGCPDLRVLRLANTPFTLASVSAAERNVSPGFPNLEELSIGQFGAAATYLSDDSLDRILKSSSKLRLLDVRGWSRITTSGLIRIPAWELQHLFLSRCEGAMDNKLELLMQKWQHSLKEVDLSWNTQEAVDAAIRALTSEGESSCLTVLQVAGTNVTLSCIKMVLTKCNKLSYLDLTSCRGLLRGMKRLYQDENIEKLKDDIEAERFL